MAVLIIFPHMLQAVINVRMLSAFYFYNPTFFKLQVIPAWNYTVNSSN